MTRSASAQPPDSAALDVARTAFVALEEMRWEDAARLFHPESVRRFRAHILDQAMQEERILRTGVHASPDPGMPPEVAAWFEKRNRELAEQAADFATYKRLGLGSRDELGALSEEELIVRWLRAHDPREQMLPSLEGQGDRPPAAHGSTEPDVRRTAEAVALADDTTAYVIYRTYHVPEMPAPPQTLTLRLTDDGWRIWHADDNDGLLGISGWAVFVQTAEERLAELKNAAERVVAWPSEEAPEGRALIVGWDGTESAPSGLRIEVTSNCKDTVVVEIPHVAFASLIELLLMFAHLPTR